MQGASVKQTRSVCSERARTPAGGRSRCGFAKQIRGFSAQSLDSKRMRCLLNFSWPNPASTDPPYRGESNSVQGASVKQTRSVCSERARTPTGGRSRRGFAKQIRGFSAQSPNPKEMCCRWHFCQLCPRIKGSPVPRRIELCAGRGRKENALATQAGTRYPVDRPAPLTPKPARSPP